MKLIIIKLFIVASVIAIVGLLAIIVYLLLKIRQFKSSSSNSLDNDNQLDFSKEIIVRLKAPNSRLKDEFIKIIRSELNSYTLKNAKCSSCNTLIDAENIIEEAATRAQDWVMEQLRREGVFCIENLKEPYVGKSINSRSIDSDIKVEGANKQIFYATAVDEDGKTFCEVTKEYVRGESVFKFIEETEGLCSFEVCEESYSMVLKESEYLKGACNLNREGCSRVITTNKGKSSFNENTNKWEVKEPAKVTFE